MRLNHIARVTGRWLAVLLVAGFAQGGGSAMAQQIWFGPRQPARMRPGAVDSVAALFAPGALWPKALAATRVFILEPSFIAVASDAELRRIGDFLTAHHVGIDIDIQSVAKVEGCGGIEGYAWPPEIRVVAERLHRLGIPVGYIHLDGPLWFGHYDQEPLACRVPVDALVARVAQNVREFLRYYPDVTIVDVEGIPGLTAQPGWRGAYRRFRAGLHAAIGRPLSGLQLDVNWNDPGWRAAMRAVAAFTRQLGMQLGVIYNGSGADQSGAQWMADAERHVIEVEGELGIIPDQAVFASWNPYPTHALPETAPDAHTHLIDFYIRPRTRITATRTGAVVTGRLTTAAGRPLPGAVIVAALSGVDRAGPLPVRVVAGVVPARARAAIIGIRLNRECNCDGPNDVLFGDIGYQETAGGTAAQTVPFPALATRYARSWPDVTVTSVGGRPAARARVAADRSFLYNSPVFSVTPGARYRFSVPMASVNGSGTYGEVTIIWLAADGAGFARTNVVDPHDEHVVGATTTGPAGAFRLRVEGSGRRGHSGKVHLLFPGSINERRTAVVVR